MKILTKLRHKLRKAINRWRYRNYHLTHADGRQRFWHARCECCGWQGSSRELHGGYQTLAGDYDEVYCPKCGSTDVNEA